MLPKLKYGSSQVTADNLGFMTVAVVLKRVSLPPPPPFPPSRENMDTQIPIRPGFTFLRALVQTKM